MSLEGITVADFSHAVAGPFSTMLLADMGANVIKIEHPHGDHFRYTLGGSYYAMVNRNKRCISLNLKLNEAKVVAKKLISKADILVESFTPGTMDRLGLGFEVAKKLNKKIIFGSISGFGQTGPYREQPGYDVIAQAMSGLMMSTGEEGKPPVRIGASLIDLGAGMYMANAILLALINREKTGTGQRIDISLLDTALSWMGPFIIRYSTSGEVPKRYGSALPGFSPYQVFKTADGYIFIGASTERFWARFCEAIGAVNLQNDERFKNNELRIKHRNELNILIEKLLSKINSNEIIKILRQKGVPCAPVMTVKDAIEDEHVKERAILEEMDHPIYGKMLLPRSPILRDGKLESIKLPSPDIGEHTKEIMSEIGFSKIEIDNLINIGAAVKSSIDK